MKLEPNPRELVYYVTPDNKCPTREFLAGFTIADQIRITDKLELLALYGTQLKRPYVSVLEQKIYEFRIEVRNVQVRLLFFFHDPGKIVVVTHGLVHKSSGTKKHQKIPQAEIERAVEYRAAYMLAHPKETQS
jgi:phage-related protein